MRTCGWKLAAALALAGLARMSEASNLYSTSGPTATDDVYTINQTTGAATLVGPSGPNWIGDLTSRLSTSVIYGADITNFNLVTINPGTGLASAVAPFHAVTGGPVPIVSLAFDNTTATLYGNTAVSFSTTVADTLYKIDPVTAITTPIGAIGTNGVFALGFDNTGKLFGVASGTTNQLLSISTATGVGTVIATLQVPNIFDIASRPEDNVMFATAGSGGDIWRLNTVTGAMTDVGPHGSGNSVGLAFLVPEPGTIGLLGLGVAGLMGRRRRM